MTAHDFCARLDVGFQLGPILTSLAVLPRVLGMGNNFLRCVLAIDRIVDNVVIETSPPSAENRVERQLIANLQM